MTVCVDMSRSFFFFKQKTAYEMRISDWSSDVCSSDLRALRSIEQAHAPQQDRFLRVNPVFGLVEYHRLRPFEHARADFLPDMRRQAMQEDRVDRKSVV